MRITLQQTGSDADLGDGQCCICKPEFYLGPATCWAISEKSNILWGEVCPACIEGGPEKIQRWLDVNAWGKRISAEQATEAAEEGITDCPTLDEVLAAEAFYERPMFRTAEEYDDALSRGEID